MKPPVALTIAGTDSGGGAGVAADLKTFEAHGVWGTVAVTAVTAQNTLGVQAYEEVAATLVRAQIGSVAADIGLDAAKTGMLPTAEIVEAVAAAVGDFGVHRLVVDPVLVSTHGARLQANDAMEAVRHLLLARASVVTPNLAEASVFVGREVVDRAGMEAAGRALVALGAGAALVKGGHLSGQESPDCLVVEGEPAVWLEGARLGTAPVHGTGCVLAAAICAELARGMEPVDACVAGKRFVEKAIAARLAVGAGIEPVNPGWERLL